MGGEALGGLRLGRGEEGGGGRRGERPGSRATVEFPHPPETETWAGWMRVGRGERQPVSRGPALEERRQGEPGGLGKARRVLPPPPLSWRRGESGGSAGRLSCPSSLAPFPSVLARLRMESTAWSNVHKRYPDVPWGERKGGGRREEEGVASECFLVVCRGQAEGEGKRRRPFSRAARAGALSGQASRGRRTPGQASSPSRQAGRPRRAPARLGHRTKQGLPRQSAGLPLSRPLLLRPRRTATRPLPDRTTDDDDRSACHGATPPPAVVRGEGGAPGRLTRLSVLTFCPLGRARRGWLWPWLLASQHTAAGLPPASRRARSVLAGRQLSLDRLLRFSAINSSVRPHREGARPGPPPRPSAISRNFSDVRPLQCFRP